MDKLDTCKTEDMTEVVEKLNGELEKLKAEKVEVSKSADALRDQTRRLDAENTEMLKTIQHLREQFEKLESERNMILESLNCLRGDMQKMTSTHQQQVAELVGKLELVERSSEKMEVSSRAIDKLRDELERVEVENLELSKMADHLRNGSGKLEKERNSIAESYDCLRCDFQKSAAAHKQQVAELLGKLQFAEKTVRSIDAKAQKRLSDMHDSLEREHSEVVAQLQSQLVDKGRENALSVELLHQKHTEELKQLKDRLESAEKNKENNFVQVSRRSKLFVVLINA